MITIGYLVRVFQVHYSVERPWDKIIVAVLLVQIITQQKMHTHLLCF